MRVVGMFVALLIVGCSTAVLESDHAAHVESDGGTCASVVCDQAGAIADPCCTVAPPLATFSVAMSALFGSGPGWAADTDGCMQFNYAGGSGHLLIPLAVPEESVLVSTTFQLIGDGQADVTASVFSLSSTMIKTVHATMHVVDAPPVWTPQTMTMPPSATVPAGGGIILDIDASAVNPRVGTVIINYY